MSHLSPSLSIAWLFLIGCGALVPTEGPWVASDFTYFSSSCDFIDTEANVGDASLEITLGKESMFSVVLEDMKMDCLTAGDLFDCDAYVATELVENFGMETSLTYTLSGTFNAYDSMNVDVNATVDCIGDDADCSAFTDVTGTTLPCSFEGGGLFLAQN